MEITINLRISADETLTSLLKSLNGTKPGAPGLKVAKQEPDEDLINESPKVSVEELREVASALMVKNKAALKEILVKYSAKTVAALDESKYAAALADMKKAMK